VTEAEKLANQQISDKYRRMRWQRHMSQCDLALEVGVSQGAIHKFEKNPALVSANMRQRIIQFWEAQSA